MTLVVDVCATHCKHEWNLALVDKHSGMIADSLVVRQGRR